MVDGFTLTTAQLVALFDESDHLQIDAGLEVLDSTGALLEDVTADLVADGSSVGRNMTDTLHGRCSLALSKELNWGAHRVRPYLLASSDGTTWYRFDLGIYLLSTPDLRLGQTPNLWQVDGFDLLDLVNVPITRTISVASTDVITTVVTDLLVDVAVIIEPSTVTGAARVFSLVDNLTLLGVCNDLLTSIGHTPLFVDRAGTFRSGPLLSPGDTGSSWEYSTTSATTTVVEDRSFSADFYARANQIVAVIDAVASDLPADGSGMVTVTNDYSGPTSVEGRGGRVIPKVIRGDWATQAALEQAANEALDAEKRVVSTLSISAAPNPILWHSDVVTFDGDRFLVTGWELPLGGGDMSLTLEEVA